MAIQKHLASKVTGCIDNGLLIRTLLRKFV